MRKKLLLILAVFLSVILFACNLNKTFVVKFYDEGVVVSEQTVKYNKLLGEPKIEQRVGLFFGGWYSDSNFTNRWSFDKKVKDELTLYAKWTLTMSEEDYAIALKIEEDLNAIRITKTSTFYNLPTTGSINGSPITWKSSDSSLIFQNGRYLPLIGKNNKEVILTATSTIGYVTLTKEFVQTITPEAKGVVTNSKEINFTNLTSEFEVLDGKMKTYFVNNGYVPYVDIKSFLSILDGFTHADEFEYSYTDSTLRIDYQVEYEDEGKEAEIHEFYAILDFEANTFFVNKLDFFDHYYHSTQTDYAEGISYLESYVEEGTSITFDLNRYRADLIIHQDGGQKVYLMPFSIANTLFTSGSYYSVYYNGDGYYGVYAIPSSEGDSESVIAYNTIRNSSSNGKNVPPDLALATFDNYAFILDHFYGLKAVNEVDTYYDVLYPRFNSFNTTTATVLSNSIFESILKDIDELHTSFSFSGYHNASSFNPVLEYVDQFGPRVSNWYLSSLWPMQASLKARFGTRAPNPYRFLDSNKTTAVIYLDGFLTASVNEEKNAETDSDVYMRETLNAIFASSPNVENIVVDLSYNMGGNLGALLRVMGYITEKPIEMSYHNPTDGSNITYFAELETDAYENFNWFFLTSGVTFSAGNLMAAIGKHQKIATIIGTTSGGGASSITPMILPDGTFFSMSSLNVLSLRVELEDGSYRYDSIEFGIEPDYYLSISNIQTDSKILEIVNRANADRN